MEFPLEELKDIFSIAKPTADIIIRLYHRFKEAQAGKNQDRQDNIKRAILILRDETQAKKSYHIGKFVENTLDNPECELEDGTIFAFLKDIEQMTWRQLCLLEGFKREDSETIEISGFDNSDTNEFSIQTEIKKLIDLNYLGTNDHKINLYLSTSFKDIYISQLGREISSLLDLESVEISEIGKAFGGGRIQEEKVY